MAQLARPLTEISRSTGTWILTSGTDAAAMCNEVISDGTASEIVTPSVVATHTLEMKFGLNHDGNALARPNRNTGCMLRIDTRFVTGAVICTAYLVEGTTVRDTWNIGTLGSSAYNFFLREIPSSVIDSIVDFTDLRVRIDWQVGTGGNRGGVTYCSLRLGDVNGAQYRYYKENFTGLSKLPAWWEQYAITTVTPTPVDVSGGSLNAPSASTVLILTNYRYDLVGDMYAEVKTAASYDNTKMQTGAFIRQKRNWTVPSTDSVRYDMVDNSGTSTWDLKYDGGASVVMATVGFGTIPNLVAGDRTQTRAVGTVISGRKNGVEILSFDDSARPALTEGYCGIVLAPLSTTPWIGIDEFIMASVAPPMAALPALNTPTPPAMDGPLGLVAETLRALPPFSPPPATTDVPVLPGAGVLTVSGFAPAVVVDSAVAPGVGTLSLTGFAPSVVVNTAVAPNVGTLTLTGFAPSVVVNTVVNPGAGALTLSGFAPTVATPIAVTPGVGAVVLSGFAPTVQAGAGATPGTGALTLTGFAPTVAVSNNQFVTPGAGALALTGFAPTVATPISVLPGVGVLTLVGFAPSVFSGTVGVPGQEPGTVSFGALATVSLFDPGGLASLTDPAATHSLQ